MLGQSYKANSGRSSQHSLQIVQQTQPVSPSDPSSVALEGTLRHTNGVHVSINDVCCSAAQLRSAICQRCCKGAVCMDK